MALLTPEHVTMTVLWMCGKRNYTRALVSGPKNYDRRITTEELLHCSR